MKQCLPAAAALLLAACITPYDAQEIEAVRDYVAAHDLEEVEQLRYNRQLNYTFVNDYFVIIPTRREYFLAEFVSECRELRLRHFTPEMYDVRTDSNTLRARFDTIRGCRIGKLYAITEEQADELKNLGDAPGDEVFLPDND